MRTRSVPQGPLLLTVPDTARRLNRHEQTVRAMIRRGDLAAVRLGRLIRVFAEAVEAAALDLTTGLAPAPAPARIPRAPRRLAVRARV